MLVRWPSCQIDCSAKQINSIYHPSQPFCLNIRFVEINLSGPFVGDTSDQINLSGWNACGANTIGLPENNPLLDKDLKVSWAIKRGGFGEIIW